MSRDAIRNAANEDQEISHAIEQAKGRWPDSEHRLHVFEEHGQWWVMIPSTGTTWSAHEFRNLKGEDGYCFEIVSAGELDL